MLTRFEKISDDETVAVLVKSSLWETRRPLSKIRTNRLRPRPRPTQCPNEKVAAAAAAVPAAVQVRVLPLPTAAPLPTPSNSAMVNPVSTPI